MFERFDYYGYDRTAYSKVLYRISESNARNTGIMLTFFILSLALATLAGMVGLLPRAGVRLYVVFFVISLVYTAVIFLLHRYVPGGRFLPVFIYGMMAVMVSFSILSSADDMFQAAMLYPSLILMCGLALTDRMIRFSAAVILCFAAFIVSSFAIKTPSVARYDLIYAFIFTFLCLYFHYRFQSERLAQYITAEENTGIKRELEVLSGFDARSGLLVSERFFSLADRILENRKEGESVAFCIMDLDGFNELNHRLGHRMGDKLIQMTADTVWKVLGADLSRKWTFCEETAALRTSFAARLGGDEFVMMIIEQKGGEDPVLKAGKIREGLKGARFGISGGIKASFGITRIKPGENDMDEIYERADAALVKAKAEGGDRLVEK